MNSDTWIKADDAKPAVGDKWGDQSELCYVVTYEGGQPHVMANVILERVFRDAGDPFSQLNWFDKHDRQVFGITHWMLMPPMPAPPKPELPEEVK